jgi:hypothetical protein
VKASIRTAEEAMEESFLRVQEAPLETSVQFASRRLPVQDRLDAFFAGSQGDGSQPASQQIAQLTTRAVSLSQATLSHAWALRRLVERYGGRDKALPARSRWLLEVMIRDHGAGLETGNRRLTELLVPVLSAASAPYRAATGQPEASEWTQASLDLFETANVIDQHVRVLFGGADPPRNGAGTPSDTQLITELLEAFQRLETTYAALTAGIPTY